LESDNKKGDEMGLVTPTLGSPEVNQGLFRRSFKG